MIDLKSRLVNSSQVNQELDPFVMAIDPATGKHVPCWLEWHNGEGFDPNKARVSVQPKASKDNVLARFRLLPKLEVSIDGEKTNTFRAVCDRSMGGDVGVVNCDGGTLWTVLP